jgi:CelD/BcsL family acetyltransferase involved in cellulose biosynthesis
MGLEVRLYRDPEALQTLSKPWKLLWEHSWAAVPFLHPAWSKTWWDHFGEGKDLYLFTFHTPEGRLVGVAPLFRRRSEGASFQWIGGEDLCDSLDFLFWQGLEEEAFRALNRWLLHREERSSLKLDLHYIRADSPTLSDDNDLLVRGWDVEIIWEETSPYVPLERDWETFLRKRLRGKDRHELRRKLRRIEKALSPTFHLLKEEREWERVFQIFCRLHRMSDPQKAEFLNEKRASFLSEVGRKLFREGMVRLAWIQIDGTPLASTLSFVYGGVWGLYNSGYHPSYKAFSPGIAVVAFTLQQAIREGLREYDFLRGGEAYKYRLGARDRDLYRLRLSAQPGGDHP